MDNSTSWEQRPVEIAYLLNPAFLAVLLHATIHGFQKASGIGMPYAGLFLAMPLILHKPTRDALPRTIATKLTNWKHNNPFILVDYHERTRQVVPYVKEGMVYGLQAGLFVITDEGVYTTNQKPGRNMPWPINSEAAICCNKAEFVGRWFEASGDIHTLFSILEVQP